MELPVVTFLTALFSFTIVILGQGSPELVIFLADKGIGKFPGAIYEIHIGHMNFSKIPLTNISDPVAITYDIEGEQIYWTDIGTKQIRTAAKDGSNDTVVAQLNDTASPEGLTLDSNTRQVFYTDRGNNAIVRIDMDTFDSKVIVNTNLHSPKGIVADTKNRNLYWVDRGTEEKIETCDYDGGQRRTLLKDGVFSPNGITLDPETGRLYWADGVGHIGSILVDGTERRRVYFRAGLPFSDISIYNRFIFLTMLEKWYIAAMPEDGSQFIALGARHFLNPSGIHMLSPNYKVAGACANGRYGVDCGECGYCSDGDICEKTTGTCLGGCQPGYQGFKCKTVCDGGTYGEKCGKKCPNCKTGTVCDHITGTCPNGCQWGFKGDKCDQACGSNTYGNPCEDCGSCAIGTRCDEVTGACPNGCVGDLVPPLCKPMTMSSTSHTTVETPRQPPSSIPVGLVVGVSVGLAVVIIAVVLIVAGFIMWRRRKLAEPGTYVEMDSPQHKEQDNSNLGNVSTSGIVLNSEELGQQTEMNYSLT